ncbi:MAG: VPLPA-CTERM-specific exosortase XrtD [Gammaproteobacteria bacterium]|nr:MAG: VPLPA-CTERM-specific exosortase XrtD [Gammaproteobacteria bacterium]
MNPELRALSSMAFLSSVLLALITALAWPAVVEMVGRWSSQEEYSYGYLIPLISLYLAWNLRGELSEVGGRGRWIGFVIFLGGVLLCLVGLLSTIRLISQYSLIVILAGLVGCRWGVGGIRILWAPLLFLVFMIPLPPFLYNNLSQKLQLISSELGVWVIRQFGISVFLEGNVIDLGSYKLQVAEACNGLRYLFPLMSVGFLCAWMYRAPLWQRLVVFLSTIPITVLMNSFRIGVIGVLVEHYGIEQAEGFLHDFEGWIIFMACFGILLLEIGLLNFLFNGRKPFRAVFGLDPPGPVRRGDSRLPAPVLAALVSLLIAAPLGLAIGQRQDVVPPRQSLIDFPDRLGAWQGRRDRLEAVFLDALKLHDYIISDYLGPQGEPVNFYVAWYDHQHAGSAAHSPRSCIPGGGWHISSVEERVSGTLSLHGQPVRYNRVEIRKGDHRQLVYYWFVEQGRVTANEYLAKWYIFWHALTRNRTDGALVRLVTPILPGEDWADGDARLLAFMDQLRGHLDAYIPE